MPWGEPARRTPVLGVPREGPAHRAPPPVRRACLPVEVGQQRRDAGPSAEEAASASTSARFSSARVRRTRSRARAWARARRRKQTERQERLHGFAAVTDDGDEHGQHEGGRRSTRSSRPPRRRRRRRRAADRRPAPRSPRARRAAPGPCRRRPGRRRRSSRPPKSSGPKALIATVVTMMPRMTSQIVMGAPARGDSLLLLAEDRHARRGARGTSAQSISAPRAATMRDRVAHLREQQREEERRVDQRRDRPLGVADEVAAEHPTTVPSVQVTYWRRRAEELRSGRRSCRPCWRAPGGVDHGCPGRPAWRDAPGSEGASAMPIARKLTFISVPAAIVRKPAPSTGDHGQRGELGRAREDQGRGRDGLERGESCLAGETPKDRASTKPTAA